MMQHRLFRKGQYLFLSHWVYFILHKPIHGFVLVQGATWSPFAGQALTVYQKSGEKKLVRK